MVLGDCWSLIAIRDMMFGNRLHFRERLSRSEEGIAPNDLAARLKRLLSLGLISKGADPSHNQKAISSLTEPAIQLVPVLAMIGAGGRQFSSPRFTQILLDPTVKVAMDGRGRWMDNVMIERLWRYACSTSVPSRPAQRPGRASEGGAALQHRASSFSARWHDTGRRPSGLRSKSGGMINRHS